VSYDNVRQLRQNQTPAEVLLWAQLRAKRTGARFRRQHAIGPFIVDFYCNAARLAIEVDGEDHDLKSAYDERRTAWLSRYAVAVVRFSNRVVTTNLEGVVRTIEELVLAANPSP